MQLLLPNLIKIYKIAEELNYAEWIRIFGLFCKF